jgi:hypothetical protein
VRDGRDIEQAPSLGDRPTDPLECVECGTLSTVNASGWRGYRTDEPETDDLPELLFYCPSCAEREFG